TGVSQERISFDLEFSQELKSLVRLSREVVRRVIPLTRVHDKSNKTVRLRNLLQEGDHHWDRRTLEGFRQAVICYSRGAAVSPDDPRPQEGLSVSYLMLATYGMSAPSDVLPKFLEA